jgi:hypothetical protein
MIMSTMFDSVRRSAAAVVSRQAFEIVDHTARQRQQHISEALPLSSTTTRVTTLHFTFRDTDPLAYICNNDNIPSISTLGIPSSHNHHDPTYFQVTFTFFPSLYMHHSPPFSLYYCIMCMTHPCSCMMLRIYCEYSSHQVLH